MVIHVKLSKPKPIDPDKVKSIQHVCQGLRRVDGDFPYIDYSIEGDGWIIENGTACKCCNGVIYDNPTLDPHTIQAIFRTYGGWNVAVNRWAPELSCGVYDNIQDYVDNHADREYMEEICSSSDVTAAAPEFSEKQSQTSTPETGASSGVPLLPEWVEGMS